MVAINLKSRPVLNIYFVSKYLECMWESLRPAREWRKGYNNISTNLNEHLSFYRHLQKK